MVPTQPPVPVVPGCTVGRGSVVSIATRYSWTVWGSNLGWGGVFRTRQDQPWVPSNLLNKIKVYMPQYLCIKEYLHLCSKQTNALDRSVCVSLTQLYDDRDMYRIYYIKTTTCFGTLHWPSSGWEIKNLVNSYTRLVWVVYSGEVRGEFGMRSRMCYVGWVVWVHGFCYYMLS